jgi:hypothetical protein
VDAAGAYSCDGYSYADPLWACRDGLSKPNAAAKAMPPFHVFKLAFVFM